MATVRTTIGNRANDNVDIASVSGTGPWTVTLIGAPPASTVVGDKLSDEAASPKLFLITAINGADLTVRDAFGASATPSSEAASQAFTARSYADVNAWNAAADSTTLYANGDTAEVAVCEEIVITTQQTVSGGATVGLSQIVILGHENYRHAGTVISTGRISTTQGVNAPNIYRQTTVPTRTEWLICSKLPVSGATNDGYIVANAQSSGAFDVENCLVFSNNYAAASGDPRGISNTANPGTMHVQNCAVWGVGNPTTALGRGLDISNLTTGSACYNCTAYGNQIGVIANAAQGDLLVKNVISMGSVGNDFQGTYHGSSSNNCSEDATVPGINSLINQVVADTLVDAPAGNLHRKDTALVVTAGVDLSGVRPNIEIDIDGQSRVGLWDIGADFEVAAATTLPVAWREFEMFARQVNTTNHAMLFFMADETDFITGETGLTPAVQIRKPGGAFGAAAGTVTEIGSGWYQLAGNATDRNTLGDNAYRATATGAAPTNWKVPIVTHDPFDVSTSSGDATLANQTAMLNHLVSVKGTGFVEGTHALDQQLTDAEIVAALWSGITAGALSAIKGSIHEDDVSLRTTANSAGRALNALTSLAARTNNANLNAVLGVEDASGAIAAKHVYHCRFQFIQDDAGAQDKYRSCRWYEDDTPLDVGVTDPKIRVINAETGVDLIAESGMIQAGTSHLFSYTATGASRITNGLAYAVRLKATID